MCLGVILGSTLLPWDELSAPAGVRLLHAAISTCPAADTNSGGREDNCGGVENQRPHLHFT